MTDRPLPAQRRRQTPAVTKRARACYLELLAAGWSKTHAAREAGTDRRRVWELARDDEAFAEAQDDAFERGTDVFRDELRRRAVEGVEKPVTVAGEREVIREYSDRLLELELKRRDPSYRDSGQVGSAQPVVFVLDSLLDRARRENEIEGEITAIEETSS